MHASLMFYFRYKLVAHLSQDGINMNRKEQICVGIRNDIVYLVTDRVDDECLETAV
jgi:hypothetical protein